MSARLLERAGILTLVLALVLATPASLAIAPVTSASAAPPGMVGVPNDQTGKSAERVSLADPPRGPPSHASDAGQGGPPSDLPAVVEAFPDRAVDAVHASRHASSLNVSVAATESGGLAIVATDDEHSAGRDLAIEAAALEDALGYRPEVAYVTHESGEQVVEEVRYRDGYATVPVDHFSTNTITWAGEVDLDISGGDGASASYSVSTLDSVDNFSIDATGSTATEWDNESFTGLQDGDSVSLSVGGNMDPTGPGGGEPQVSVTSQSGFVGSFDNADGEGRLVYADGGGAQYGSEIYLETPPPTIDKVRFNVTDFTDTGAGFSIKVYVAPEAPDGDTADGTESTGFVEINSAGQKTIDITNYSTGGDPVTIGIDMQTAPSDGTLAANVTYDTKSSGTWGSVDGTTDSKARRVLVSPGGIRGASVSVGDDTASIGSLDPGATGTARINISESDSSVTLSADNGVAADVDIEMRERTQTVDPSVSVNGNWSNHTGTLSDGESVALPTNKSWVQEGTNMVNVSMPSLSADAPAPSVSVDYYHEAEDKQTVNYSAGTWTESYNVSHTFAESRSGAQLTIPLSTTVIRFRSLKMRTNGGSWSSLSGSSYVLDGTTATVDLGSVSAGDTVTVVANASAVTTNGGVEVLEATSPDESLDSKIKVTNAPSSDPLRIDHSGAVNGDRMHRAYSKSWEGDHYLEFDATDSEIVMPSAPTDGEFRVKTYPVSVAPEDGTVRIDELGTSTTEPTWTVEGGTAGSIAYTFETAGDGNTYALVSESQGITLDEGTASSPLTLEDSDGSNSETLAFVLVDNGTSSGSSSGGGFYSSPVQSVSSAVQSSPISLSLWGDLGTPLILLAAFAGLALVAAVGYLVTRRDDDDDGTRAASASSSPGTLRRIGGFLLNPLVVAGVVVAGGIGLWQSGLFTVPPETLFILLLGAAPVVLFLVMRRLDVFSWRVFAVATALIAGGGILVFAPSLARIPPTAGAATLILAVLGGLYLLFRRFEIFDWRVFVGISVIAGTFGVELVAPGTLGSIASNVESNVLVIAVVAIAGLLYLWLRNRGKEASTPDEVNRVTIETDGGSDSGGDGS